MHSSFVNLLCVCVCVCGCMYDSVVNFEGSRPEWCISRMICSHGWEIAVILRNLRKTKLSKSKFLFFFFFFVNSISPYIQCATR